VRVVVGVVWDIVFGWLQVWSPLEAHVAQLERQKVGVGGVGSGAAVRGRTRGGGARGGGAHGGGGGSGGSSGASTATAMGQARWSKPAASARAGGSGASDGIGGKKGRRLSRRGLLMDNWEKAEQEATVREQVRAAVSRDEMATFGTFGRLTGTKDDNPDADEGDDKGGGGGGEGGGKGGEHKFVDFPCVPLGVKETRARQKK